MASTAAAIRDRVKALIEALTPTSDTGVRFRSSRNEGAAKFMEDMDKTPTAAHRRFQARIKDEGPPEVSNTDIDMRHVTATILIAYPQSGRWGPDGALDRDDVIQQDFAKIEQAIGIYGQANFPTGQTYYATCLGNEGESMKNIIEGAACDFLEVTARFSFYRTVGG